MTIKQVAVGVFIGMWCFAVTGAIVYWGIAAAIRAQII